jgi:hypothetical protein
MSLLGESWFSVGNALPGIKEGFAKIGATGFGLRQQAVLST